jgi:hypothetical protein
VLASRRPAPDSSTSKLSGPSSSPPPVIFLTARLSIALSLFHGMLIGHEGGGDHPQQLRCDAIEPGEAESGALALRVATVVTSSNFQVQTWHHLAALIGSCSQGFIQVKHGSKIEENRKPHVILSKSTLKVPEEIASAPEFKLCLRHH